MPNRRRVAVGRASPRRRRARGAPGPRRRRRRLCLGRARRRGDGGERHVAGRLGAAPGRRGPRGPIRDTIPNPPRAQRASQLETTRRCGASSLSVERRRRKPKHEASRRSRQPPDHGDTVGPPRRYPSRSTTMPAAPGSPHSPGSPSKARGLKVRAVIKFGDRTSTLTIPCGDGKRTVRWLGVVAAQRFVLDLSLIHI